MNRGANGQQWEELVKVHNFTRSIEGVPTRFVPVEEATKEEPYVRAKLGYWNLQQRES